VPGSSTNTPVTRANENIDSLTEVFEVVAYPNPFDENFVLHMKTENVNPVNITVYDMTGRILENFKITVDEVNYLKIGNRFPNGIYNVIVTQDKKTKIIRLVNN
jgi:hypothetical protein